MSFQPGIVQRRFRWKQRRCVSEQLSLARAPVGSSKHATPHDSWLSGRPGFRGSAEDEPQWIATGLSRFFCLSPFPCLTFPRRTPKLVALAGGQSGNVRPWMTRLHMQPSLQNWMSGCGTCAAGSRSGSHLSRDRQWLQPHAQLGTAPAWRSLHMGWGTFCLGGIRFARVRDGNAGMREPVMQRHGVHAHLWPRKTN
jgi:hypothetical protein